jgi:hypothetical protein
MVVSDEVDTNGTRRSREGAGVQRELPDGRNFRKLALLDNACGSVKNFAGSKASRTSLSSRLATLTAMTLGCGTRGFFGATRSIQTQTKPFGLPLLRTEKAKWLGASSVSGNDRAIRRTSACVAIETPQLPYGSSG